MVSTYTKAKKLQLPHWGNWEEYKGVQMMRQFLLYARTLHNELN